MTPTPPRRRWYRYSFQFGIATMLMATATVAIVFGVGVRTHLAIGTWSGAMFAAFAILLSDLREPYWGWVLWVCLALAIGLPLCEVLFDPAVHM